METKTILKETKCGNVTFLSVYRKSTCAITKGNLDQPRRRLTPEEKEKHRNRIALNNAIISVNAAFGDEAYFVTLTYADNHYFETTAKSVKNDMTNWIRRIKYEFPDAVVFAVYGEGGKYGRFHVHAIVEGLNCEEIKGKWAKGYVMIISTYIWNRIHRPGLATDYSYLTIYMMRHWSKEYGGHRYSLSRNAPKPIVTSYEITDEEYSLLRHPTKKGYKLVCKYETEYRGLLLRFVKRTKTQKKKGII